jgi:hypothetical protein
MSTSFTLRPIDAALVEYRSRAQELQSQIATLVERKRRAVVTAVACSAIAAVLSLAAFLGTGLPFSVCAIPSIASLWGLRAYLQSRARAAGLARRLNFFERGIDRQEGTWRGNGRTGMEFAREHHLYQSDLDILGEGSLFELLATTRSEIGAERLANFLLDPTSPDEARARQSAVKELRGATSLREKIAVAGIYQFQNCHREHFREWLDLPILKVPGIVPVLLLLCASASFLLGLVGYAGLMEWMQVARVLIPLLLAQAGIGLGLMKRVRARMRVLITLRGGVSVLRTGVELIERQQFNSEKLLNLIERLRAGNAAAGIRRLERVLIGLERREDVLLYGFSLWLAAGTQLVLAAERWRATHEKDFEGWLDAWAEFEALNALGGYAWEHPEYEFPELVEEGGRFEADDLGHPLLPRERCVGNAVALNNATAFYVISGSNMAGKSTFLRAIGLNAVLAAAGAPVRARGARLSVFLLCASIAVKDSLQEGKSRFLAEVQRLRESISIASEGRPVLFLIDEVLGGTNSGDRRIAAEALIGALVAEGAVGALSTHDLALTSIIENSSLRGVNVHMESKTPDQPLVFDYRVKPGIAQQTNALAIVRMMGISV